MKKFLTVALLVMALCVVSMAVSAEISATYEQSSKVATVTADIPTAAGQGVVLVVKGENLATSNLTAMQAEETLAENIVYVDQATTSTSANPSFSFIPRDNYEGKSTVFYSDGSSVKTTLLDTTAIKNFTVKMTNGESVETVTVASNASYTLPVLTKVGYKFDGWFAGETQYTVITNPTVNYEVEAQWTPYFNETADNTGAIVEDTTNNEGNGVADATVNADGTYKMSVTTTVGSALMNKELKEFGFYIYNNDKSKVIIASKKNASLDNNNGFYAIINDLAAENADENICFKPFAIDSTGATFWGKGVFYTASGLATK